MAETFLQWDYWLLDLINQKGAFAVGDAFFPWITDLHHTIYFKLIFIPFILFMFVRFYSRKGITLFIFLLLALAFNDFMGARVKNHYLRLRPFENNEIVVAQRSSAGSKSFYSNHTSNMFTFAVYTGQFIPVLKAPTLAIAATVAYSRVYNGVHYPSDVFAGGLMGTLWGLAFAQIAKRIVKKIHPAKKETA